VHFFIAAVVPVRQLSMQHPFNFAVPAEANQVVGTATASNRPTSWAITAGNTGSVFSIDAAGQITGNAGMSNFSSLSNGVQPTTYTLTVQATNAQGSGSDNILVVGSSLPWASLSNRPQMSGASLTWTGPIGGGPSCWDDSAQSHALTTHSGNFTSSSDGQLIQYLDITGGFILQHNNVTLSRCRVQGTIYPFSMPSGSTGFVMEDVNFTDVQAAATPLLVGNGDGAIIDTTIRRCASHDVENNITKYALRVLLKDSIFYNVTGADADQWELYTTATGNNGVGSTNYVTICHNTYQGPVVGGGFYNSAINLTNWGVPNDGTLGPNIYVDNNYFNLAGNSFSVCDDSSQGTGTVQWNCTNNGFFSVASYRRDATTILINSGNFVMATAGDFTGTLTNGTGAI